jgi:hypothetical protein
MSLLHTPSFFSRVYDSSVLYVAASAAFNGVLCNVDAGTYGSMSERSDDGNDGNDGNEMRYVVRRADASIIA